MLWLLIFVFFTGVFVGMGFLSMLVVGGQVDRKEEKYEESIQSKDNRTNDRTS